MKRDQLLDELQGLVKDIVLGCVPEGAEVDEDHVADIETELADINVANLIEEAEEAEEPEEETEPQETDEA